MTLPVVAAVGMLTALISAVRSVPSGVHAMAFHGVVDSLIVTVIALVLVSGVWQTASRTWSRQP